MRKLLIIDDEEDICTMLEKPLKKMGFVTYNAQNISEGFIKFTKIQPQTIFLDINLPDGNGLDLLPKLKKYHREKDTQVKVVIISAYDGVAERSYAEAQGADYFLGKPFSIDDVKIALSHC